MTDPALEEKIRAALRHRADEAPSSAGPALAAPREPSRPRVMRSVVLGAAAASLVAVIAVAATNDDGSHVVTSAAEDGNAPVRPAAERTPVEDPVDAVPMLGFDSPGFKFQRVTECEGPPVTTTAHVEAGRRRLPLVQTFGRSYWESPLMFLHTVSAADRGSFGLVRPEIGDPFTARGLTGYATRDRAGDRGWTLSVELPDGRALYAVVLGLGLEQVTPTLDRLTPRPDGGWDAPVLPSGLTQLERSTARDGCGYSAVGDLPDDAAGGFEVSLYDDAFDWRLADRAASTVGAVVPATVDGVPAAFGSYRADDHWVMFEPEPGRTMEIRASAMTRDDVLAILGRARFVDRATWQGMRP